MPKQDFQVTLNVTSTHIYLVPECNSPEEAISIAEDWFADGEEGLIDTMDIDSSDAVPSDGEEEFES